MKVALCGLSEIPADGAKEIDFFGREVLMMKVNGSLIASLNVCMHLGGPMKRQGDKLVTEWHGAAFQCGDGKCLKGLARPDSRLILLPACVDGEIVNYVYGD